MDYRFATAASMDGNALPDWKVSLEKWYRIVLPPDASASHARSEIRSEFLSFFLRG